MKRRNTVPAAILAALLLACLIAVYVTRESGKAVGVPQKGPTGDPAASVDSQLLATANQMAALAETADEQNAAREALRLTDHEVDQNFATALRQAAAYRPPATGPLHDLSERVDRMKFQIAVEQSRIAELAKQPSSNAATQLDVAKAQLALDQDDLEDAQQDLARQGGDPHSALERAMKDREAAGHESAQALKGSSPRPTATLFEQTRAWFSLGSLDQEILAAQKEAADKAKSLSDRHNQLERQSDSGTQAGANTADQIAGLRRLSEQRKTLAELDQRIQDCQQLAGVYQGWSGLIEARRRAVLHWLLGSLAEILAILLAAMLAIIAIRRLFHKETRKRLHQAQLMAIVAVQIVALGLILLVLFGPPNQLSTIIGLATAGLTVVLRDFIVAFFGWFTLIGKNGIRVGDWVEINGVSGEVIQLGVLKTVLLESGNWTETGHPTGRQVTFSNSFAMEGHYFNFSTAGQWLWDELEVALPAGGDPYGMAEEIRKLVERETDPDAAQATEDWERVTKRYGARSFSAKPSVSLRPTGSGLSVVVRYITRAPQRNAMKSKLFQVIVDLMHKPSGTEARA
ncbi:MAG: mechanosensitive ion channel [Acidobacteriia bacterium]|nr:mechanosensitive ion channel [Terriglobia bacterium]